ncbi:MAG TPA: mRNA surveillance protein pelota [archaeon]|nr:mRNA surveillance protein pelota [archaeon]
MKVLKLDRKENFIEIMPDSLDDLWHVEKLVEKGDLVSGSSERKIKPKTEGEKAYRQKIFVELEVEKIEFHEETGQLRILGVVVFAKPEELVELKSHHTIEVEPGTRLKISKKALKNYHIERLEKAKNASGREKLLLVVMDDEEAELAFLKDSGMQGKAKILAKKEGKMFQQSKKENTYFEELFKKMDELKAQRIVVAGPGFERQNFEKFLKEKNLKIPVLFESTNSVGITGLNELIKSGKIDEFIQDFQSAEEAKIAEKVFVNLATNQLAAVGMKEVKEAIEAGAVEELVVEEKFLAENRSEVEELLDKAEQLKGKIHFISWKSEAGKKISGIGGVAAILRYKMKW